MLVNQSKSPSRTTAVAAIAARLISLVLVLGCLFLILQSLASPDPSLPGDHSALILPILPVPPSTFLDSANALLSAERQLHLAQQRRSIEAQHSLEHHASLLHALRRRVPADGSSPQRHIRLMKREADPEPKGAKPKAPEPAKAKPAAKAPKADPNAWKANIGQFTKDADKSAQNLAAQKSKIKDMKGAEKTQKNAIKTEQKAAGKLKGADKQAALANIKKDQGALKDQGKAIGGAKKEEGKINKTNQDDKCKIETGKSCCRSFGCRLKGFARGFGRVAAKVGSVVMKVVGTVASVIPGIGQVAKLATKGISAGLDMASAALGKGGTAASRVKAAGKKMLGAGLIF